VIARRFGGDDSEAGATAPSYDHGLDLLTPIETPSESAEKPETDEQKPLAESATPNSAGQPLKSVAIKPEEEEEDNEAEKPGMVTNSTEEDPLHWSFTSELPPKKVADVEAPTDVECGPSCQERRCVCVCVCVCDVAQSP
jgi:hypothetical protein